MSDEKIRAEIASVERRNFFRLAGAGGFTAAAVVMFAALVISALRPENPVTEIDAQDG